MTRSLRWRLLAGTSLAGITVLALLGASVYAAMRHALLSDFDHSLGADARLVSGMIEQDGSKLGFEFDSRQMPDFVTDQRHRYFEIWRDDGSVLARSPSLGGRDLQRTGSVGVVVSGIALPDGIIGHALNMSYSPAQQEQDNKSPPIAARTVGVVVAAEPIEVHRTLAQLAGLLAILCTAAVVVMGFVLWRVVGRSLRPVTALAGEIGALRETDLARCLQADDVPEELTPVVDKLNGLLGRLQQAFEREKAFTSDVAHELRTPLAGLRSTLEVCRSRPRDPAAYESALDDCRGITDRMEAMVQSLLLLARWDAGQIEIERRSIDVSIVVSDCWSQFHYRAEHRKLNVTLKISGPCMAATDADKLHIVLHNLLDNAVSYIDDGGSLRIMVCQKAGIPTIEIANTGSQIATDQAPRLFERFWRGDAARTDSSLHCGLGLSLSQRLTKALGGDLSIQTIQGGDFVAYLELPAIAVGRPYSLIASPCHGNRL